MYLNRSINILLLRNKFQNSKVMLITSSHEWLASYWILIVPFSIALTIRLIFWYLISNNNVPEFGDGAEYFKCALKARNIVADLLYTNRLSYAALDSGCNAVWPPMQSFVLTVGMLIFGGTLTGGRLTMALASALTAPLVYLVTYKLSSQRTALLAAIIFAIYPGFIHYSFRLYSETTYIFLSFLMFYCALMLVERSRLSQRVILWGIVTGFVLGLIILTRASGLIWIPTIAAWAGRYATDLKRRLLLPILILIVAGITVLPWEVALFMQKGRFIILTTSDSEILYRGNNSFIPAGWGSLPGHSALPRQAIGAAKEYGRKYGVSSSEAFRQLAIREISNDPLKFLKRGIHRLQTLFSFDDNLVKLFLLAIHPPINANFVIVVFLLMLFSHLIFLWLAIWGLFGSTPQLKHRELIIILVLSAMVTHFISLGHPRHGLPLFAVLSVAVGHGLAQLKIASRRTGQFQAVIVLIFMLAASLSVLAGFRSEYFQRITPTSYYAKLVRQLDQIWGINFVVGDRLIFRTKGDDWPEEVIISPVDKDFEFLDLGTNSYTWTPSHNTEMLDLKLQSQTAQNPLQLQLESRASGKIALISLGSEAWYTWQSTNIPGIEYRWIGSADYPALALHHRGLGGE